MSLPTQSPAASKEALRLTRDDWLQAAFNAVVQGGMESLKVLTLAEKLGVTRGSFYWHFADHAEWVRATLLAWKSQEMQKMAAIEDRQSQDPLADMQMLLNAALDHSGDDFANMRFELAARDLGRRDAGVAALLVEIDQARTLLFEQYFLRWVQDPLKARDLAALFYLTVVGCYQAMSRAGSPARSKDYFKSLITTFLIQAQAPHSAA